MLSNSGLVGVVCIANFCCFNALILINHSLNLQTHSNHKYKEAKESTKYDNNLCHLKIIFRLYAQLNCQRGKKL